MLTAAVTEADQAKNTVYYNLLSQTALCTYKDVENRLLCYEDLIPRLNSMRFFLIKLTLTNAVSCKLLDAGAEGSYRRNFLAFFLSIRLNRLTG